MAKPANVATATVDLSDVTLASLTAAADKQRAANALTRQGSALPAQSEDSWNGSAVRETGVLPFFLLDPTHVNRQFSKAEIGEIGKTGSQVLGATPRRAIVYMLGSDHKLAGGKDGIFAVYDTDDIGIQCATPKLLNEKSWLSLWSQAADFDNVYLAQKCDWLQARERDQSSRVRQTQEREPLGMTYVTDLSFKDISGQSFELGRYRFFSPNGIFWSLIAPLIPNHLAQKVCAEILPGQKLPKNSDEQQYLSGMVAIRAGVRPMTAMGNLFMNLPMDVINRPELVRSILDPNLAGPVRMANFHAIRAHVNKLRKAQDTVTDVPAKAQEPETAFSDADAEKLFG